MPQLARLFDEFQVLLGQLQDRDLAQIDLLRARQGQQQVERPLEAVDIDDQRLGGEPFFDAAACIPRTRQTCALPSHQRLKLGLAARCQWASRRSRAAKRCFRPRLRRRIHRPGGTRHRPHLAHLAVAMQHHVAPGRPRRPRSAGDIALKRLHRDVVRHQQAHQSRSRRGSAGPSQARSLRAQSSIASNTIWAVIAIGRSASALNGAKSSASSTARAGNGVRQVEMAVDQRPAMAGHVLHDRRTPPAISPSATARASVGHPTRVRRHNSDCAARHGSRARRYRRSGAQLTSMPTRPQFVGDHPVAQPHRPFGARHRPGRTCSNGGSHSRQWGLRSRATRPPS